MTISLGGGGDGPDVGGMTSMGGRPVQTQTPPEELAKREPVRPPAAKTPEMTVPLPDAKPVKAAPRPTVKQAPDEARGRTPTRGAQTSAGHRRRRNRRRAARASGCPPAAVPDPARRSTSPTSAARTTSRRWSMRIRQAWNQNQGAAGQTMVKFTIQRDGTLTDVEIERPSGTTSSTSPRCAPCVTTTTLPPLPGAFPNPTLTVHLNFQYQ